MFRMLLTTYAIPVLPSYSAGGLPCNHLCLRRYTCTQHLPPAAGSRNSAWLLQLSAAGSSSATPVVVNAKVAGVALWTLLLFVAGTAGLSIALGDLRFWVQRYAAYVRSSRHGLRCCVNTATAVRRGQAQRAAGRYISMEASMPGAVACHMGVWTRCWW